jgi:Fe-S-cluster containining protein
LNTNLQLNEKLPLTCSRTGTCCHGNQVLLNPWELHRLAFEKQISAKEFRRLYCDWNGILLKFNGEKDHRGKSACSQYVENFGCSLHEGRPLACRLFPIGRQIQNQTVQYIHQGETFPCLNGCPEVIDLPKLTVEAYLRDQKTKLFEQAQDEYLEFMQNCADIALMLLLDTGLAAKGDQLTRKTWRQMGVETPNQLGKRIGATWLGLVILPEIKFTPSDPSMFVSAHQDLIFQTAQHQIDALKTLNETREFAIQMMAIALFLGKAIGADVQALAEMWSEVKNE